MRSNQKYYYLSVSFRQAKPRSKLRRNFGQKEANTRHSAYPGKVELMHVCCPQYLRTSTAKKLDKVAKVGRQTGEEME